ELWETAAYIDEYDADALAGLSAGYWMQGKADRAHRAVIRALAVDSTYGNNDFVMRGRFWPRKAAQTLKRVIDSLPNKARMTRHSPASPRFFASLQLVELPLIQEARASLETPSR